MVKEELRDIIAEVNPEAKVFENLAYDDSIIGMTTDGRVVYSYYFMVQELMKDEGFTEEEAREWIDYNTIRSLPYIGDYSPVILDDDVVFLEGKLGKLV